MVEFFGGLGEYLGFPVAASEHALTIDHMNGWIHWLMLILFIGWGAFFIFTLYKFGIKKGDRKADYKGLKSHYSTYAEYGVILFEVFLIIGFALPLWATMKTDVPTINDETIEIRVIAQQFDWNIHYPGADGEFGTTNIALVDEETNPIGLIRYACEGDDKRCHGFTDSYECMDLEEEDGGGADFGCSWNELPGADDIVTRGELHIPVNKDVMIYLSSKDVIHSFSLPEMRVKQDAIPGMTIPVFFKAILTTENFLKKIKYNKRGPELYSARYEPLHTYGTGKENWEEGFTEEEKNRYRGYQISCAQLCGNEHSTMRGFMTVETMDEYEAWLEEQAEDLDGEEEW